MNEKQVLDELASDYSEWIEMAGEESPALLLNILAAKLIKEREKNAYYRKLLESR